MGQAAVALVVIGRPLAVLGTVALPAVAVARRAMPRAGVALWVVSLVLLAVWGGATYRAALAAAWWGDRPGGGWQPHTRDQNQALLDRVGLTGPF